MALSSRWPIVPVPLSRSQPASAAAIAGVRQLASGGRLGADDRVVAVLTGHVLKEPGVPAVAPTVIEPTLDALERAIDAPSRD
jgi:threonine synthase